VTGRGRNQHIWKGIGGNSIFDETASDALSSSSKQWKVVHFDALKIRRYLVPWGFNSPSRHHLPKPQGTRLLKCLRLQRNLEIGSPIIRLVTAL